jgi:hypothetical protein
MEGRKGIEGMKERHQRKEGTKSKERRKGTEGRDARN